MKSWKTTLIACLSLVSVLIVALTMGMDAAGKFSALIAGPVGLLGLGLFARDNDKSSERVGAK